ncbi:MAG: hypothetical protein AB2L20_00955 [Mangrovibacterium sp.]
MKEEKKEIIKQDLQGAEQLYILYVDRQQRLQKIIDDVAQMFRKYFVVPDDQLSNFVKNKPDFDRWITEKIKEEVSHFSYVWQQQQTMMELQPIVEQADKLHGQIEGLFKISGFFRRALSTGQNIERLDINNSSFASKKK